MAAVVALLASQSGSAGPTATGFSARVDNPWFPLKPGTTYVYHGVKDGQPSRDVLTATHQTKTIAGAPCVVVKDLLYLHGRLHERTTDWYTQDRQAGRDGARPGIFMPADPTVGQSGRQEFYIGHAEDHFKVISLHANVQVPYVTSKNALLTEEWTPLEPGVIDHKYYVRGIGNVLERTVKGGDERNTLISVRRGL
ncbi:MAG: hypothetical protein E6G32_05565 [Actinobacteria bacterium]|nr:MAG: hypothetical protein E6G32_05565 [Actinomycetota bacterium]